MKSIDNKKAPNFGRCGAFMMSQYRKSNMNTLTQNSATANNQALVVGEFKIRQDDDGRYCINDLHKASGGFEKNKPFNFFRTEQTKEIIREIESEFMMLENEHHIYDVGNPASCKKAVNTIRGKGKNQGTYVVKELVYSYAMWISAKFHLTVIRAYDALVMQWKINDRQTISTEQQALLHEIVDRRSKGERKIYAEMWSRHNRHFKIPRYAELHAIHFPDAVHYLETMEIKAKPSNEVKIDETYHKNVQGLAIHMLWVNKWWREFGEAIRTISPRMAGAISDHFSDGACFAYHFIEKPTRLKIDDDAKYYPWHSTHTEQMALTYNK